MVEAWLLKEQINLICLQCPHIFREDAEIHFLSLFKGCTFSKFIMCFWYVHLFFSFHFCAGSFFTERYFGFPAKEESQYQV